MNSWIIKIAWRDSRPHRKRLLLFVTSIILGVAAIVSIGSFGVNLDRAVDDQAKTLLGADLKLSSLRAFSKSVESFIDSLGGEQAREFVFASMAYFEKTNGTRLVQIRAIEGRYPFYGDIGTEPPEAAAEYQYGRNALVDETLLLQYKVGVGDTIKVGNTLFYIAGKIVKLPNEPAVASTINPRVFIPARYLPEMNVMERGSRIARRVYFKFDDKVNVGSILRDKRAFLKRYRISAETVTSRKERIGEVLANLYRFLNLVGFVSLVLGSLGVASAVHVYTKQKLPDAAVLRCLGAKGREAFLIYVVQVMVMSLVGSLLGAAVGISLQMLLPSILGDFLPVEMKAFVVWNEIVSGVGVGLTLALLFALLPLLTIRNVSPLFALRAAFENGKPLRKDRLRLIVLLTLIVIVSSYAVLQTRSWRMGLSFSLGLSVVFVILAAMAKLVTWSARRFFPRSWGYIWRQGLSNLYRPNNQTLVLMVAIGLGTFLITTLYLSHQTLLSRVSYVAGGHRPNLVLFDIQPDQREDVVKTIRSQGLPIIQEAAMVTMRPEIIKGETVESILLDSTRANQRGLLRWEFRATYRDTLFDSEELIAGHWVGSVNGSAGSFPISMEESAADYLNVTVGDTIVWDVQGVELSTWIASLRKVDWQRIQANFMVVFPTGVLEHAPQIFIISTKVASSESSAILQRTIVQNFPNVSIIDIGLVLKTLDALLDNISFAIRFMAFFSIVTGLIVLAAAVIMSRFQRIKEVILLRTLGATRKQTMQIMLVEYIFLGSFAALTGLLLSYLSGWALAYFVFHAVFVPNVMPFFLALFAVIGLTAAIGLLNSRGILDRPPLEILRAEA